MRICIDSCVFIYGLSHYQTDSARVLDNLKPPLFVTIPRLIVIEVTRNLKTRAQVRAFFDLVYNEENIRIVDEPVPRILIEKYTRLGLPEKADAVIGAFAEWEKVRYVISTNRHFLHSLQSPTFVVLPPDEFLYRKEQGTLYSKGL